MYKKFTEFFDINLHIQHYFLYYVYFPPSVIQKCLPNKMIFESKLFRINNSNFICCRMATLIHFIIQSHVLRLHLKQGLFHVRIFNWDILQCNIFMSFCLDNLSS